MPFKTYLFHWFVGLIVVLGLTTPPALLLLLHLTNVVTWLSGAVRTRRPLSLRPPPPRSPRGASPYCPRLRVEGAGSGIPQSYGRRRNYLYQTRSRDVRRRRPRGPAGGAAGGSGGAQRSIPQSQSNASFLCLLLSCVPYLGRDSRYSGTSVSTAGFLLLCFFFSSFLRRPPPRGGAPSACPTERCPPPLPLHDLLDLKFRRADLAAPRRKRAPVLPAEACSLVSAWPRPPSPRGGPAAPQGGQLRPALIKLRAETRQLSLWWCLWRGGAGGQVNLLYLLPCQRNNVDSASFTLHSKKKRPRAQEYVLFYEMTKLYT